MIQVEQHGPITAIRMARSFLGKPLHWTTAYWVDGLLIDAGPRCAAPELVRILKQVPVEKIVITHGHEDTMGGLATLKAHFPNATLYASQRTIPILQDPTRLHLHLYQRISWGVPEAVNDVVSLESVSHEIRTTHHQFRALETPGHCRDHVSYFEPQHRWLFCGDAFIGGHDRTCTEEFDLLTALGTLHTLNGLRPERLLPASGVVRRSPSVEIGDKINYFQKLAADVARLEATGMNPEEMLSALFKEEAPIAFWTQKHYSSANLIRACQTYNSFFTLSDSTPPLPPVDATTDHSDDILAQLQLDDLFAKFDENPPGAKPQKKTPPGKKSTDAEDHKR